MTVKSDGMIVFPQYRAAEIPFSYLALAFVPISQLLSSFLPLLLGILGFGRPTILKSLDSTLDY